MVRPRTQRVTARSIIEGGLLTNVPDAEILRQVKEQLPDSAADQSHIQFYRSRLKKDQRLVEQLVGGEAVVQARADVPYMGELETVELAGERFMIMGSMTKTDQRVCQESRTTILRVYKNYTGNDQWVQPERARTVVRYMVLEAWYKVQDKPVPEFITQRFSEAIEMAKKAQTETAATETVAKEPRVSSKSIITQGLLAGKPDEAILAEVKAHNPDGKADASHLSYYRSKLYASGELERPVHEPKPAKAPAAASEASAPAKATPVTKKSTLSPAKKAAPAKARR